MAVSSKNYFGSNDLNQLISLLHTELAKYVLAVTGKDLSDENFTAAYKAILDGYSADMALKANLASPAFTGVPTAPTATVGTDTTQVATTAYVLAAIAEAFGDSTGIRFESVASFEALPATGEAGVIYLVPNSGSAPNVKDEYFWDGSGYELFGTTEFDPSNYLQDSDVTEIPTADVTAAWNAVFNPVSGD